MPAGGRDPSSPRIDVVGLGPAGPELITAASLALIESAPALFLRTARHPAAAAFPGARSFDHHYERADTIEGVYRSIADELVTTVLAERSVVYAVPGSPAVAERSVALLLSDPRVVSGEVAVEVHPALSFLDLAFLRLGVDPVTAGVRVIDAEEFAVGAAGDRGPLLVAQCWSRAVLSEVKLSVESPPAQPVTILHHLGLPDERVWEVPWEEIDRGVEPDHLTSLWIPVLAPPVASELVALDVLVHTLRERCPWDRRQTHASLGRHLLEESYEVLEAIDALAAVDARAATAAAGSSQERAASTESTTDSEVRAVAHLEEELGDLLFQVLFHSTLAAEAGRFTLADVARGVHDKLVSRHPHVFGGVDAPTAEEVATNWEAIKKAEKGRSSVTEGIPAAFPSLALAAKLQRKAVAVGMVLPGASDEAVRVADGAAALAAADRTGTPETERARAEAVGALLFSLVGLSRAVGIDPETALLSRAAAFRAEVEQRG